MDPEQVLIKVTVKYWIQGIHWGQGVCLWGRQNQPWQSTISLCVLWPSPYLSPSFFFCSPLTHYPPLLFKNSQLQPWCIGRCLITGSPEKNVKLWFVAFANSHCISTPTMADCILPLGCCWTLSWEKVHAGSSLSLEWAGEKARERTKDGKDILDWEIDFPEVRCCLRWPGGPLLLHSLWFRNTATPSFAKWLPSELPWSPWPCVNGLGHHPISVYFIATMSSRTCLLWL